MAQPQVKQIVRLEGKHMRILSDERNIMTKIVCAECGQLASGRPVQAIGQMREP